MEWKTELVDGQRFHVGKHTGAKGTWLSYDAGAKQLIPHTSKPEVENLVVTHIEGNKDANNGRFGILVLVDGVLRMIGYKFDSRAEATKRAEGIAMVLDNAWVVDRK